MTPEPQSNDAPIGGDCPECGQQYEHAEFCSRHPDNQRAENWNHTCQTLESQIRDLKGQLDVTRVANIDLTNIIKQAGVVHDARRTDLSQLRTRAEAAEAALTQERERCAALEQQLLNRELRYDEANAITALVEAQLAALQQLCSDVVEAHRQARRVEGYGPAHLDKAIADLRAASSPDPAAVQGGAKL